MSIYKGETVIAGLPTNLINTVNNKANVSLDNLNSTGEGHFAKLDASNFTTTGKSTLSSLSMPSSRYIDLTLGATGTTYDAPANGWYCLSKIAWTAETSHINPKYIQLLANDYVNGQWQQRQNTYSTSNYQFAVCCLLPVRKGQRVWVGYDCIGATMQFRFYYAEGEQ